MIDLGLLRKDRANTIAVLKKKDPSFDAELLASLDEQVRALNIQVEELRNEKNSLARAASSGITPEIRERSKTVSQELKEREAGLEEVQARFMCLYLHCPNILMDDIPEGNKEHNKVVKTDGEKPTFSFTPKNHVELGKHLDWFDFEAAVRMTGSNFVFYKNEAVNIMYALTRLMIKNNKAHGYSPVIPPFLVNEKTLESASNFPRFKDQVYSIEQEDLFLTPTAEVNLTSLYRDHIFETAQELPIRMTAWTSCFRREAGSYGAVERGLIRIHQFEKVELYALCTPGQAEREHERMLACAENILQTLGLHYRVSLLAAQDCSFASAKTYDIEVWMPGQNAYYEVSSCSNCTDFQSRRSKIRYREVAGGKTELVNTLNCSSLALPRLVVALMETYQQEDGSIKLPEALMREGW